MRSFPCSLRLEVRGRRCMGRKTCSLLTRTRKDLTFSQMCTELGGKSDLLGGVAGKPRAQKPHRVSGRSPSPPDSQENLRSIPPAPLHSQTHTHTCTQVAEIYTSDTNSISSTCQGLRNTPQHSCSLHLFMNPPLHFLLCL